MVGDLPEHATAHPLSSRVRVHTSARAHSRISCAKIWNDRCLALPHAPENAVESVEEQVTKSATTSSSSSSTTKSSASAVSENTHSYQHQESYIEQVSSVSKSKQYIQQTASEEFLVRERLVNGKHDSVSTVNSSIQQQHSSAVGNASNGSTSEHDSLSHLNGNAQSSSRYRVFSLDRLNTPQTGGLVTAVQMAEKGI
uniref:Uncharacterized protein n=1 Tax=Anopheles atroparvus TaxID=41427 RepID=A0A182JI59_ANOAO